jgi:putative membrane protein
MMFGGAMIFSWIFWIVVIAGLTWLLFYIASPRHSVANGPKGRYMDILKERFARGEISREEYEDKRRTLLDK